MVKKEFQFGNHRVTLETGRVARQATGSVMVSMDDTVLLVACVARKEPSPNLDFFPFTVDYQEKTYAAGKIPGGFFKREGRPSEKETLTSRLIDRPLRPLFPKGFKNEVQIIATVLSVDPEIDPDIPALIGSSAAVALAGLPCAGPVGAARVGYKDGGYLLNPTGSELKDSKLNLVVAGTRTSVLMVESEAQQLSEEVMLGAVMYGHEQFQVVLDNIQALVDETGICPWDWQPPVKDDALAAAVQNRGGDLIREAYAVADKLSRRERVREMRQQITEAVSAGEEPAWSDDEVSDAIKELEGDIVRQNIIAGNRIDGRGHADIRDISVEIGVLPRTHGSALFTRGDTQALVVTTLGAERDAQIIDAIEGERKEPFMLHYNFPPFCVAETGRVG